MDYLRIFSDAAGETHFDSVEIAMTLTNFAPPAPAFAVGPYMPATQFAFCAPAPGWFGDWHPTPTRQFFLILQGVWEVTASDGETRRLEPGCAVLLEDTSGKGHATRILGDAGAFAGIIQLP